MNEVVEAIKRRFSLRDAAQRLGVMLPNRVGPKFRSPFRADNNPSCNTYWRGNEERFKDWSRRLDLDCIQFYAQRRGISNSEAIRELSRELPLLFFC